MRSGDLISGFMKRIGLADRVIVVLSDKYLRSAYCMTELYSIYQRSLGEKEDFLRRITPIVLDDARFGTWRDRLAYTTYWRTEFEEMEKHLKDVGEMDFGLYKSMQEWHNRIADILSFINDVLCPHGFDDIVKDDFAGLCPLGPSQSTTRSAAGPLIPANVVPEHPEADHSARVVRDAAFEVRGEKTRRIVLILHGIRDEGEWMTELRRLIENESDAKVAPLHPERISFTRFLLAARYPNYIKKYRDLVSQVLANYKEGDVVFIAHSYGTWCLADIIRNWSYRENLKPVGIVLCGSILPQDTPWGELWNRVFRRYREEQDLPWVWNDIGGRDPFPLLARLVSKHYGNGRFTDPLPGLVVNRIHADMDHGGFFIKQEPGGKTVLNAEFIRRYWLSVIRGEDAPRYGDHQQIAPSIKRLSYWVETYREVGLWFAGLQILGWCLITFGNSPLVQTPGRILVVSGAVILILWLWNGVRENPSSKKAPLIRSSAVLFAILTFLAGIAWITAPLFTTISPGPNVAVSTKPSPTQDPAPLTSGVPISPAATHPQVPTFNGRPVLLQLSSNSLQIQVSFEKKTLPSQYFLWLQVDSDNSFKDPLLNEKIPFPSAGTTVNSFRYARQVWVRLVIKDANDADIAIGDPVSLEAPL